jgi:peptide/nickel transport system permease protein
MTTPHRDLSLSDPTVADPVVGTVAPAAPPGVAAPDGAVVGRRVRRPEFLHFALRNRKLLLGLVLVLASLLLALVGPSLTDYKPLAFEGVPGEAPSSEHWFGTTASGQDVFSQFVYGLRSSFVVGVVGGGIAALVAMAVGFVAGYRGGVVDELLSMLTNVVLVIPTIAVLVVVAAMRQGKGSFVLEGILIGLTSWPWAARAVRAQTFSLVSRDFVDIARLSGRPGRKIITAEIAPNMSSYLLLMFILLFGNAILIGALLDFLGLGPSSSISLGLMMQNAVQNAALLQGYWWWFVPPGVGIIAIVGGLYVMNVGLDEVFNPKLRET